MKIITPGDLERTRKIKRFICPECGCVFEADKDEYKYSGSQIDGDSWCCFCPTCKQKVYTDQV